MFLHDLWFIFTCDIREFKKRTM